MGVKSKQKKVVGQNLNVAKPIKTKSQKEPVASTEIAQKLPKEKKGKKDRVETETQKQVENVETSKESTAVSLHTCALEEQQVIKAVDAAFKAYATSKESQHSHGLFDDEPEPVHLIVSCIKVAQKAPKPLRVCLPHPIYTKESDICLIVKDLEKGWKVDHEPTAQHYMELLESNDIDYINEVMPLRQLRVEYKPFEARGKLAKRFDLLMVDKRVAKFVPRYLGKAFFQQAKLPILVDVEAENIAKELEKALSISTMSMTFHGTSSVICVGSSNFEKEKIVQNIMAVYEAIEKKYPGKFLNIRALSLRFGTRSWTLPIYMSYASMESVTLPTSQEKPAPLIDDLTTLPPGMKVAVYRSGDVQVVKDDQYQRTALDQPEKTKKKKKLPGPSEKLSGKNKRKEIQEDLSDEDEEMEDDDEDFSDLDEESSEEDETENSKEVVKPSKSSTAKVEPTADDSSDDEGNTLEDQYMEELAMMEEDEAGADEPKSSIDEEPPVKKVKVKAAKLNKPAISSSKKVLGKKKKNNK